MKLEIFLLCFWNDCLPASPPHSSLAVSRENISNRAKKKENNSASFNIFFLPIIRKKDQAMLLFLRSMELFHFYFSSLEMNAFAQVSVCVSSMIFFLFIEKKKKKLKWKIFFSFFFFFFLIAILIFPQGRFRKRIH